MYYSSFESSGDNLSEIDDVEIKIIKHKRFNEKDTKKSMFIQSFKDCKHSAKPFNNIKQSEDKFLQEIKIQINKSKKNLWLAFYCKLFKEKTFTVDELYLRVLSRFYDSDIEKTNKKANKNSFVNYLKCVSLYKENFSLKSKINKIDISQLRNKKKMKQSTQTVQTAITSGTGGGNGLGFGLGYGLGFGLGLTEKKESSKLISPKNMQLKTTSFNIKQGTIMQVIGQGQGLEQTLNQVIGRGGGQGLTSVSNTEKENKDNSNNNSTNNNFSLRVDKPQEQDTQKNNLNLFSIYESNNDIKKDTKENFKSNPKENSNDQGNDTSNRYIRNEKSHPLSQPQSIPQPNLHNTNHNSQQKNTIQVTPLKSIKLNNLDLQSKSTKLGTGICTVTVTTSENEEPNAEQRKQPRLSTAKHSNHINIKTTNINHIRNSLSKSLTIRNRKSFNGDENDVEDVPKPVENQEIELQFFKKLLNGSVKDIKQQSRFLNEILFDIIKEEYEKTKVTTAYTDTVHDFFYEAQPIQDIECKIFI